MGCPDGSPHDAATATAEDAGGSSAAATPARSVALTPDAAEKLARSARRSPASAVHVLESPARSLVSPLTDIQLLRRQTDGRIAAAEPRLLSCVGERVKTLYEHVKAMSVSDANREYLPRDLHTRTTDSAAKLETSMYRMRETLCTCRC